MGITDYIGKFLHLQSFPPPSFSHTHPNLAYRSQLFQDANDTQDCAMPA